jgi:hypothetical protein
MDTDPFQIPTAAELRDGLRGDIERLRAALDAARQALNENDLELAKAMGRASVLEAEVKASRARTAEHTPACEMGFHDRECDTCRKIASLPNAIATTDRTHALDAGKFRVGT